MIRPIIESLIRYKSPAIYGGRYSEQKIADLLGKTRTWVKNFIHRNLGFTITQARVFFDTNYIGHHKYDYYTFN